MKPLLFLLSLLSLTTIAVGKTYTSTVDIYKLYSQNGKYCMVSIPFDNEEQSIFGKTEVYKVGENEPFYTVNRHFNMINHSNKINLSNDGQTIFYVNDVYNYDKVDELKAITVYVQGELFKHYTVSELTNCNSDEQDCSLLYRNEEVVNLDSSKWINHQYIIGFNEGTAEKEQFANRSNIFSHNDSIYFIDQFKQLHIFDLKTGIPLKTGSFDSNYPRLSQISRNNKIEIESIKSPSKYHFPSLTNGKLLSKALANNLDMVDMDFFDKGSKKFKRYTIIIDGIIDSDGKLEIIELKTDSKLPKQKISDFLMSLTFDIEKIPSKLEKWRFDEHFYFRNKSKSQARKEKRLAEIEAQRAYEERLTKDSLNGVYIPQNMEECFIELDSLLKTKDKVEMKSLPSKDDMILYHHGLGTSLRNSWGLWGGSRLQKYFNSRGVYHPDSMSAIILEYYHDWLNGKSKTWMDWEKENPVKKG